MDHFSRIKDTFAQYLSPVAKRRRTAGPATPSNDTKPTFLTPASDPQGINAKTAVLVHITSTHYITPEAKNPRKRAREEDEPESSYISSLFDAEEADITGITEDDSYVISPNDSISQTTPRVHSDADYLNTDEDVEMTDNDEAEANEEVGEEDGEEEIEAQDEFEHEDEDENEEAVEEELDVDAVAAAKVQEYLARQAELVLRKEDVAKAKARGDLHPDALFVVERLAMRSFEELLPAEWQIDFPTLPQILFTENTEKQFINFNKTSSYRGVKALQGLLNLGVRVRDNAGFGGSTEKLIEKEVKDYIKWSEKDGGYEKMRFLPVLTVVTGRPKQSVESISTSIQNQLKFLAEKHRQHLAVFPLEQGKPARYIRTPPLLYGIVVSQTMAITVTLDSSDLDANFKHLDHVQFKNKDMDVWNGFALAFMVIMARNYIISIKHELEVDDESEADPDL